MNGLAAFLLVLAIVFGVITVIGHGIWVLLAWLLSGLSGAGERHGRDRGRCVFCGQGTRRDRDRCDACGRDLTSPLATELMDLDALARQMHRFRDRRLLAVSTVEHILARVRRYRDTLRQSAVAPPGPVAQPVSASPPQHARPPAPQATRVPPAVDSVPKPAAPGADRPSPPEQTTPAAPRHTRVTTTQQVPSESAAAARQRVQPELKRTAPPPETQATPRRSWADMIAGFMEERNIRWGELVGGLLIVGSSAALVLSLWDTLKVIRYFPFVVFVAVTAALFGLGLYARHRWKLAATGLGLLIIATLLVPLDFLALAAFSKETWNIVTVVTGLSALALFSWLVGLAACLLVPPARGAQVLAVVGSSGAVLLGAWSIGPASSGGAFIAAALVPVACFAAGVGDCLRKVPRRRPLGSGEAGSLFTLLGTGVFALVVALGILVAQSGAITAALDRMAAPVALAAIPILACGLCVARGTRRDRSRAAFHTAGVATALNGMLVMLVALGLAWPHPLGILAVGLLSGATLAAAAFHYRLPILHVGAIACAVVVYLITFHVAYGPSRLPLLAGTTDLAPKLLRLTVASSSGTALAGLFVLLAIVAELLARTGRRRHGAIYEGGCVVVVLAGLGLVTTHGFLTGGPDAVRAACLYALYGAGSLLLAARSRRLEWSYSGLILLAAAPLWLLWWNSARMQPVWATVLAGESLLMGAVAAVLARLARSGRRGALYATSTRLRGRQTAQRVDCYQIPLLHVSEAFGVLALALGVATAWLNRAAPAAFPWPVVTAAMTAAAYLLLAGLHNSPERTWIASAVVLAGLAHMFAVDCAPVVEQPWTLALLVHSAAAVLAGALLTWWIERRSDPVFAGQVKHVFDRPLTDSALVSSALAVVAILLTTWATTMSLAWCLFWLAMVWLALAWKSRRPVVFAAHQVMLALAASMASTAWLENRVWVTQLPRDLADPRSVAAYAVTLGLLALMWVLGRIVLGNHPVAGRLLRPGWPAVDQVLRHAVVWLLVASAVQNILPGIGQELLPRLGPRTAAQLAASGGGVWLALGILAIVLLATLWEEWGHAELVGSLSLAALVPVLTAGRFVGDQAVASALRWGLAACFLACSMAVWARVPTARLVGRLGVRIRRDGHAAPLARATLLAAMVVPVLTITVLAALLQLGGTTPAGPMADSWFDRLGSMASYVVPLLLLILGLVGHSVREKSTGYAFSAGLVAELMVTLGYGLHVAVDPAKNFGCAELVTLIQLFTITAAVWAGAWLTVRHWLDIWREGPGSGGAGRLMDVQLGMGVAGNVLLVATAVGNVALLHPHAQEWAVAAGRPLGWFALLAVAAACAFRRAQIGRVAQPRAAEPIESGTYAAADRAPMPRTGFSVSAVALLGMAVLGLLACTIQGQWLEWGYRALMLGWAAYAWSVVSATWYVAAQRTLPGAQGPPQGLIRVGAVWVRVAGGAAVLLGLKAALLHARHEELLWAAASIAIASAAGATMAVWRRREGWAFAAALGVNLAASLVVWYFHHLSHFGDWWLHLAQANINASAAVALIWLAARRRLYQLRELGLGDSPFLSVQTALPVVGNTVLLLVPVMSLLRAPDLLPRGASELAAAHGWLALILAAASVAWYILHAAPSGVLHAFAGFGLGAGVLAACHAGTLTDRPDWNAWLPYHTLTAAWAAAGFLLVVAGVLGRHACFRAAGDRHQATTSAPQPVLPASLVQAWTTAFGVAVVVLAVSHAAADPGRPWWSAGAILSISVTAGILAVWRAHPAYVYVAGLLLCVIGTIAWMVWDADRSISGCLAANALGLATGAAVWTVVGLVRRGSVPHLHAFGHPLPFARLGAGTAVGLLAMRVAISVAGAVFGWRDLEAMVVPTRLDAIALGTTAAAVILGLWQPGARGTLPGLWLLGLLALAMRLGARDLEPHPYGYCCLATLHLAGFVVAVTVVGRVLPRLSWLGRVWRIPAENLRGPANWLPAVQAGAATAVGVLSLWVSMDAHFDGVDNPVWGWGWLAGRTVGPLAAALVLIAAVLTASGCRGRWRATWQHATLGLGLVLLSASGFAWLAAERAAWLHRTTVVLAASLVMGMVSGPGLVQLLPAKRDWLAAGRRTAPWFLGLAAVMLALALGQEAWLFDPAGGVVAWPAVAVVAIALAGLAVLALVLAVRPDLDPLALTLRGRTAYVYAAEALVGLLALHVWLTMAWLFRLGIVRHYWLLIVMAVAAIGAGLSELFHRRRMPVLAEPLERTALLLPLVPAIGYWLAAAVWLPGNTSPSLWFFMGMFYGLMAISKRSLGLGAAAMVTANVGLWLLWHRQGWGFLDHPQLWLIPLALAVLVAEHVDRSRLNQAQRGSLRYAALCVIYVSSTTEFMRGIGQSVMLPLVLIGLSLLGVLAGILLRTRSFLYLGTTFLLVVIVRMTVYAAFQEGQMWVFWSCCILLGAAIIALFGVFENRRNEVLAALERFKDWQG